MSHRPIVFAFAAACVALAQDASFRAEVQLVNVSLSAWDEQGRAVRGLTKDDFEVWEDGVRQTISFFSPSADLPLTLGLLIDGSGSQSAFSRKHRKDLHTFLKTVMTKRDQAFLVGFGTRVKLLSELSSDPGTLEDALDGYGGSKNKDRHEAPRLGPPERRKPGTAFYDAIYHSIGEKLAASDQRRKGLIVFSDGGDNVSAHHMLEVIEAAQMAAVPLFCVRYTGSGAKPGGELDSRDKYGISVMRRLALETGGADFDAVAGDMKDIFASIGEQLRASFELAYQSTNPDRDGRFRKVVIRPKQAGVKLRYKTGYYAR